MILAIDSSLSCIGWAVLTLDGERVVEYGAYKPKGKALDRKLADAHRWLDVFLYDWYLKQKGGINAYAFEMPVLSFRRDKRGRRVPLNVSTTIKLAQLVGALRVAAFEWVEETVEVNPGGRLAALGLPVNLKRAVAKERVIANVNAIYGLELKPKEHDIADAMAVGLAASRKLKLAQ